jgi:cellulose synthase/poly-beta-1,6-N-acetylglucosamine synthase-like glycosyltransferase
VQRTTNWGIRSVVSPESHVPTRPPETAAEFLQQRKRHFSAGRLFTIPMKLFFMGFHGSNLLLYISLALFFIDPAFAWGLPVFLTKTAVDMAFVILGSSQLGAPPPMFSFLFMELGLLWYNLIVGPLGILGSFTWKPDPQ